MYPELALEYEIFGVINCVFLDVGSVMLVSCHSDNVTVAEGVHSIKSLDFNEFEDLGLNPDKSWEGRRCKLVYEKAGNVNKLVGAMLGRQNADGYAMLDI